MCSISICRSTHHAKKCRLVSSGPLSRRIACGAPRLATISSSTRVTLRLAKPGIHFQGQTLPRIRIHHAQHPDGSTARHHIVRKIQRPFLVRRSPCQQRPSFASASASSAGSGNIAARPATEKEGDPLGTISSASNRRSLQSAIGKFGATSPSDYSPSLPWR
jgi:hypothetical protein